MEEILYRAASYLLIIALGASMKKAGVFRDSDFKTLAKVMLYITLPCAIIYNFSSIEFDFSYLVLTAMGIGTGLIYMLTACIEGKILGRKKEIPFDMINFSGYNIGNFSMPFAQSFLGPMGVVAISLFDTGNAVICNGGSKAVAELVKGKGAGSRQNVGRELLRSFQTIARVLSRSVPFMTYLTMILLVMFRVPIPQIVTSFSGTVAQANAFVAMLMIGVGFKLNIKGDGGFHVVRLLVSRYAVMAVFVFLAYWVLPFPLEIRQALVILVLSPIASANPAFTDALGEDFELASTVNSISMIISIASITTALLIML